MSSSPAPEEPRRSARAQKKVRPFGFETKAVSTKKGASKRRKGSEDAGNDEAEEDEEELSDDEDDDEEEDDDDDDFVRPNTKARRNSDSGNPPSKTPKTASQQRKAPAFQGGGRRRKNAALEETVAEDGTTLVGDVKNDNELFNAAVINEKGGLNPVVDSWVERYEEEGQEAALAELVMFFLRCCGSSMDIDSDDAVDFDGVPSKVNDLEDQKTLGTYPLISRTGAFKNFHAHLRNFILHFFNSLGTTPHLFPPSNARTKPALLMITVKAWLFSLSASPLRSFRHTGTVLALETMSALAEVAAAVQEELTTFSKQRDTEKRKGVREAGGERGKELERLIKNAHTKRSTIESYLKEFFDAVFVLRYRDTNSHIRTECVKNMGIWMKTLPTYFDSSYHKYIGWMLDDPDNHTRQETLKALSALYSMESNTSSGSLSTFTARFKKRICEIAFYDIDITIRTAAIGILEKIMEDIKEDDEVMGQIGLLVFDIDASVRAAASSFFRQQWEEEVEEIMLELETNKRKKKGGNNKRQNQKEDETNEELQSFIAWKCLASTLVRYTSALDEAAEGQKSPEKIGVAEWAGRKGSLLSGRISTVIDSLFEAKVDRIQEEGWKSLVTFLTKDHKEDEEERLALDDEEESTLIQVLLACLRKTRADLEKEKKEKGKKGKENDDDLNDFSHELMKSLPKLITKYKSDAQRIIDILSIPLLMNVQLYLELRTISSYESLWDEISKQFLKTSNVSVQIAAISSIEHFLQASNISNTNSQKIAELEDSLLASLRDAVIGKEIETDGFVDDEVETLQAITSRINLLLKIRDSTPSLDDSGEGKKATGWSILNSLAERGRLGYKEEVKIVQYALESLSHFVFWRCKVDTDDDAAVEAVIQKRSDLLQKLEDFAVGNQSNAVDIVKNLSFQLLLSQYTAFVERPSLTPSEKKSVQWVCPPALTLEIADELQWRCAGYVQAEIERFTEERSELSQGEEVDEDEEDDDSDEEAKQKKRRDRAKKARAKAAALSSETSEALLITEYKFLGTIASLARSIRIGSISPEHSSVILAHYGRFGPEYDSCCRLLLEDLKDLGIYCREGEQTAKVVIKVVEDAFDLFLDGDITEAQFLQLGKMIAGVLVVNGAYFSIQKKLPTQHILSIHRALLFYAVKKITQYIKVDNSKKKNRALGIFKVLCFLTNAVDKQEAGSIKTSMEEAFDSNDVEIGATKAWDAQRTYQKKLITASSKKTSGSQPERQAPANDQLENGYGEAEARTAKKPAPRKRRSREDEEEEEEEEEDGDTLVLEILPPAKKSRPKPKPRATAISAPEDYDQNEEENDEDAAVGGEEILPKVFASQKRSRDEMEDEEEVDEDTDIVEALTNSQVDPNDFEREGSAGLDALLEGADAPNSPGAFSQLSEIVPVARKRARR